MIPVQSADAHIRRRTAAVASVAMPLDEAHGRCLRQALVAQRPAPPFDRVMMDGFAVRAPAAPWEQRRFRISGVAPAGAEPPALDDPCGAIEVMTGAMLPPGTDCVTPVEHCRVIGKFVEIEPGRPLAPGQHVHRRGSEYQSGETILPSGVRLHAAHLALAASEGYAQIKANRDLSVGLVTTGDEIIAADAQRRPWEIFGTHAAAIAAAIDGAADVRFRATHVRDDLDAVAEAINSAAQEADALILCGAMSRGRKDFGIQAMRQCGFEVVFYRVAQRPGHPMALACRGATLLFGLPGNPLAVLCTLHRHVLPALDHLRGCAPDHPMRVSIAGALPALPHATRFVPCRVEQDRATLALPHNSGDLLCLAQSDGFVEIPPAGEYQESQENIAFWRWK